MSLRPSSTLPTEIFQRLSFRAGTRLLLIAFLLLSFTISGCKKSTPAKEKEPVIQSDSTNGGNDTPPAAVGEEPPSEGDSPKADIKKEGAGEPEKGDGEKPVENKEDPNDLSQLGEGHVEDDDNPGDPAQGNQADLPEKPGKPDGGEEAGQPKEGEGDEKGEAPEPTKEDPPKPDPKPQPPEKPAEPKKKIIKLKPAYLEIVTDFSRTSATVNGLPYPSYQPPGTPPGVTVPAGGPYYIVVKNGSNTKSYEVYLRPYERRVIVADLTGFTGTARAPSSERPEPPPPPPPEPSNNEVSGGKIMVYARPEGTVFLDGKETTQRTPGMVKASPGRHEVSVRYTKSGKMSPVKGARVKKNSTVRVYFRE